METAAQRFGITLSWFVGDTAAHYVEQVAAASKQGAGALLVFTIGEPSGNPHEARLIELIGQHRLPAMFARREYARAGGLMSFGTNLPALARRAAYFVDRIANGAKPADLPIEQPTKFELVINLKTAKALGLTIPQSVLLRADEVIQ
jgi:putative ABC transport system substrate-binding protein